MLYPDDVLQDFQELFMDNPVFSEDVVYHPGEGDAVPLKAVVYRRELRPRREHRSNPANSYQMQYAIEIEISRDPATGVAEPQEKIESFDVAPFRGQELVNYPIAAVVFKDHAKWRLGLNVG